MRFLADESCDFSAVRALRGAGHDVAAVAERAVRSADREVLAAAVAEERVVLTEDKDFGTLVFARLHETSGVLLLRFPAEARTELGAAVVAAVEKLGSALRGAFVVLEPGRIRVRRAGDVDSVSEPG